LPLSDLPSKLEHVATPSRDTQKELDDLFKGELPPGLWHFNSYKSEENLISGGDAQATMHP